MSKLKDCLFGDVNLLELQYCVLFSRKLIKSKWRVSTFGEYRFATKKLICFKVAMFGAKVTVFVLCVCVFFLFVFFRFTNPPTLMFSKSE